MSSFALSDLWLTPKWYVSGCGPLEVCSDTLFIVGLFRNTSDNSNNITKHFLSAVQKDLHTINTTSKNQVAEAQIGIWRGRLRVGDLSKINGCRSMERICALSHSMTRWPLRSWILHLASALTTPVVDPAKREGVHTVASTHSTILYPNTYLKYTWAKSIEYPR